MSELVAEALYKQGAGPIPVNIVWIGLGVSTGFACGVLCIYASIARTVQKCRRAFSIPNGF